VTPFWRFVHYLAFTAWIGGALAAMVAGLAMQRLERSLWSGVAEAQGAIYRAMIGPGAIVTVFTGLLLTFRMYGALSVQVGPWLGTMQGLGLVAALVTLLGAMPAASRLARLEPTGETAAAFDRARRRLAISGSIGGTLALLALLAGALYRP
jgi:hypothetical protein